MMLDMIVSYGVAIIVSLAVLVILRPIPSQKRIVEEWEKARKEREKRADNV